MKKIYFLIIVILTLPFSCIRQNDLPDQNNGPEPEISFDAGGKHYVYKGQAFSFDLPGVSARKQFIDDPFTPRTLYSFWGYKDSANRIFISAYYDSLQLRTYTYSSGSVVNNALFGFEINDEGYTTLGSDDYFELTITSYKDGLVSGTFFGSASSNRSPPFTLPNMSVTNGVIKNARIVYVD